MSQQWPKGDNQQDGGCCVSWWEASQQVPKQRNSIKPIARESIIKERSVAPEVLCTPEHLLLFKMVGSKKGNKVGTDAYTLSPATSFLFSKITSLVVKPLSPVCKALSLSGIHKWLSEKWKIFGERRGTRNSVIGDHRAQFTGEVKAVLLKLRLLSLSKRITI